MDVVRELPAPSIHLPFEEGPYRLAMGLQAVAEANWLEFDTHYAEHLAVRRRLLRERPGDVVDAIEGSEAAQQELLAVLVAHLVQHYPQWFSQQGGRLHNRLLDEDWDTADAVNPLTVVGHLVAEDFCLIRNDADGARLVAAVLCFPSHWTLAEKLGLPLAPIHGPVPFYGEKLSRPVDRFFETLKPGRIASRLNWTVTAIADLFQPSGHNRNDKPAMSLSDELGTKLFLRVERQTFRRLPQSGVVVFGIRVHVTPLGVAVAQPGEAVRLANALEALPEEISKYKSMLPFRPALLAWLRSHQA
jgi:hypothetical protein